MNELDTFFDHLRDHYSVFIRYAEEPPKYLIVNPLVLRQLSKMEGFFQRRELGTEVTPTAPVVRYLKLFDRSDTLQIIEDPNEPFLHLE